MSEKKAIKRIRLHFKDGSVWDVDTEEIARDRARYYSNLDYERGEVTDLNQAFSDEYRYTVTDDYELLDWFKNNYNWDKIKQYATLVESPKSDYSNWFNSAVAELMRDND